MSSFLDPDGVVCLRLGTDERAALIDAGGTAVEQYGRNMPDFAGVPPTTSSADLDHWFAVSWEHTGGLDPK